MAEDTCNRCGGPNVSWSAPSPLWNAVMRGGSIDGPWEHGEMICPTCFFVLARERGIAHRFRVDADALVPLETTTPSGRVWNPGTQLWDEPSDARARECGEVCTRPAVCMVSSYTFCGPCLERYVLLGMTFAESVEDAAKIAADHPVQVGGASDPHDLQLVPGGLPAD